MPNYSRNLSLTLCLCTGVVLAGCAKDKVASRSDGLFGPQFAQGDKAPASPFAADSKSSGIKQASHSKPAATGKKDPASTVDQPQNKLAMARLSERHGQLKQARDLYESELQKDPNNALIHHRLAVIASREERGEDAFRHFETARQLAPHNAQVLSDLGYAYYLRHDLDDAEACLKQAVAADPQYKAARNNLGIVLGVRGKFEEAMAQFRKTGSEAAAYANMGYVHSQLGDLDQALQHYNHALSLDSEMRPAAEAMVQLHALKSQVEAQIATLEAKSPKSVATAAKAPSPAKAREAVESNPRIVQAAAERAPKLEPISTVAETRKPPKPVEVATEAAPKLQKTPVIAESSQALAATPAVVAEKAPKSTKKSRPAKVSRPESVLSTDSDDEDFGVQWAADENTRPVSRQPRETSKDDLTDPDVTSKGSTKTAPVITASKRILEAQAADAEATRLANQLPKAKLASRTTTDRKPAVDGERPPMNNEIPAELPHQGSMALKHPTAQPTWSPGHESPRPDQTTNADVKDEMPQTAPANGISTAGLQPPRRLGF
ncbi:MAG: tetratricopeptide repeat protein [Planctomycetes bacterium]|nr:tetratricopeptide repeat protein [Planctomycetota bacterium]